MSFSVSFSGTWNESQNADIDLYGVNDTDGGSVVYFSRMNSLETFLVIIYFISGGTSIHHVLHQRPQL